jgi:hypothetical protein
VSAFAAARSGKVDDVVVSVSHVDHGDAAAVRVELEQLAIDGKNYVDLSARDAVWLSYALLRVVEGLLP